MTLLHEGIGERVADGDTVTVITPNQTKLRIRLWGIDAPETPQGQKTQTYFSPAFTDPSRPSLALISLGQCPILTRKGSHQSRGGETHGWEAMTGLRTPGAP
jgi:hypothetical protein